MAHVLIPTDFSDHALNAAVHAVRLFGGEGNRFTLLNTYIAPADLMTGMPDGSGAPVRAAHDAMSVFVARLHNALHGVQPSLTTRCEQGDLAQVVARCGAQEDPPAMVVMGTQGASGIQEVLFGSNTASVILHSGLPVLAVPAGSTYRIPRRIMLADDGGPSDKQVLKPLIDIARRSHGEVSIVRVVREADNVEEAGAAQVYDLILGAIPHTQQYFSGEHIETALNELADQGDADLLAVLHRARGIFEGLFHRSMAARLAMHTQLPLLVLQQRSN